MKDKIQEVLDAFFLVAGYTDKDISDFMKEYDFFIEELKYPPTLSYVVFIDDNDTGEAYDTLEEAQAEVEEVHKQNQKADIVATLDLSTEEPIKFSGYNLCWAYEVLYSDSGDYIEETQKN